MILNTAIFTATIAAAKTAAANRPEVIRAIDRAIVEIQKAAYWSFADGVLTIQSTTSRKLYRVDAAHTCEAKSKCCKHHIARLLMIRYSERLATAPAVTEADERAEAIKKIEKVWTGGPARYDLGRWLMRRFGVISLDMLPDRSIKQIAAAIR